MKNYNIDFSYMEPRWGTITLKADDEESASDETKIHVSQSYPEAIDIEINHIEESVYIND